MEFELVNGKKVVLEQYETTISCFLFDSNGELEEEECYEKDSVADILFGLY